MGDARMAKPSQDDADRTDGSNIDCASGQEPIVCGTVAKDAQYDSGMHMVRGAVRHPYVRE